jgi:hypothetical protein
VAIAGTIATPANAAETDPPVLFLTWKQDPAHTMVIQWQTLQVTSTAVDYRRLGESRWESALGEHGHLSFSTRQTHSVELSRLHSAAEYEFRLQPDGQLHRFRTMPERLDRAVHFITGGDVNGDRDAMDRMTRLAARFNPAFIVFGGDLAYALGSHSTTDKMGRWDEFFSSWQRNAHTTDGHLIPLLATIGNHDVAGGYHQTKSQAKVFYEMFPLPGMAGFHELDFGNYLSLLLLDSDHTTPVAGAQTDWLNATLQAHQSFLHILPIYHVPAYPCCRSENGAVCQSIRENWVPLFEAGNVRVAFENHEHAYKRTHPLRQGKVDPEGITFLGDGAWGVTLRVPDPDHSHWYLEKTGAVRHFWLVNLTASERHIMAIDEEGRVFDEIRQPVTVRN